MARRCLCHRPSFLLPCNFERRRKFDDFVNFMELFYDIFVTRDDGIARILSKMKRITSKCRCLCKMFFLNNSKNNNNNNNMFCRLFYEHVSQKNESVRVRTNELGVNRTENGVNGGPPFFLSLSLLPHFHHQRRNVGGRS